MAQPQIGLAYGKKEMKKGRIFKWKQAILTGQQTMFGSIKR